MFDLLVLPLHLVDHREISEVPGLLIAPAPRRCERSRASDLFILYLNLSGNAPLTSEERTELEKTVTDSYFKSRGSVTMGLKAAAEKLNLFLLDRNLRTSREGQQINGPANLAVLRRGMLSIAQTSQNYTFVFNQNGVEKIHDPQSTSCRVGLSRSLSLQFGLSEIQSGDNILFCPEPPASWTDQTLQNTLQLSFDQLRRRLLGQSGPNLNAVLVQFRSGTGQVTLLKPRAANVPLDLVQTPSETAPQSIIEKPIEDLSQQPHRQTEELHSSPPVFSPVETAHPETAVPSLSDFSLSKDIQQEAAQPDSSAGIYLTGEHLAVPLSKPAPPLTEDREKASLVAAPPADRLTARRAARQTRSSPSVSTQKKEVKPRGPSLRKRLAALWFGTKSAQQRVDQSAHTLVGRMLPGDNTQTVTMSPGSMLFIAIAIPLIVAAIATTIYFRNGRGQQHQVDLQKAQEIASQAITQTDPTLQHASWEQVVEWLDQADRYGESNESRELRVRANEILDKMDGVARMNLQPAMASNLGPAVNITRMGANETEIYLLDQSTGQILRVFLTAQGYEIDPQFICGPSTSNENQIGALVDLAVLPPNNSFNARVVAIDKTGRLAFCKLADNMEIETLPQPTNGWTDITALTYSQSVIYILDSKANSVWFYSPDENGNYTGEPRLFFDDDVPKLDNAIDMAVNAQELYLLRDNNTLMLCHLRVAYVSQTKCEDPAPLGDSRPGKEGQSLNFQNANLIQLDTTQPPDPSLYILDGQNHAAEHFSLRLNYQRELLPMLYLDYPIPERPATAFATTPNRGLIMAFGNELFYAPIP